MIFAQGFHREPKVLAFLEKEFFITHCSSECIYKGIESTFVRLPPKKNRFHKYTTQFQYFLNGH